MTKNWQNVLFTSPSTIIKKVGKHPDKTLTGMVECGFDFLVYFLKSISLNVSGKTVNRFMERDVRLYEQGSPNRRESRLGQYVLRWVCWVRYGLRMVLRDYSLSNPLISLLDFDVIAKISLNNLLSHKQTQPITALSY